MARIILHIDFDSFFASVEQQNNPAFRGKPLGVTATNGRTVIIAASREAKAKGIKSPSRSYEAKRICPNLLLTGAHFTEYFRVSKLFLKICQRYSPFIEVFSIDELFMDITQTAKLFGGTEGLIRSLKKTIEKEIGEYITVSVGVSHNRLLAKLASGKKKPNGVFVITPDTMDQVYAASQLTDICGIGRRIAQRLNNIGVYHLLQLRSLTYGQLEAEFGPSEARFLQHVGLGDDETPIVHFGNAPEAKSVGRNYALPKNEYNQRVILQNVFELCEEIAYKLRRLNKKAKTVGFSLRGEESMYGTTRLLTYSYKGKELFEACFFLYQKWQWGENRHMVRQISIWVSNLSSSIALPVSLFEHTSKQEVIQKTIDILNDRFGDHTIRNGFLLYSDKLTTVPNGFLADRLERKELTKELI